ncbi:MAG: hypothetical protein ACTSPV_15805 [Candidatus Hodarchaeales archaeon]
MFYQNGDSKSGQAEIGILLLAGLAVLAAVVISGIKKPPVSFIKTMEPSWASVEIREGIEYDSA